VLKEYKNKDALKNIVVLVYIVYFKSKREEMLTKNCLLSYFLVVVMD